MHWTDRLAPRCGTLAVDTSAVPVTIAPHDLRFVHGHPAALLRWLAEDDVADRLLAHGVDERAGLAASDQRAFPGTSTSRTRRATRFRFTRPG